MARSFPALHRLEQRGDADRTVAASAAVPGPLGFWPFRLRSAIFPLMFLPLIGLILLWQSSLPVELLRLEDSRGAEVSRLTTYLKHSDARIRQAVVRVLGHLERPELAPAVSAMLGDPEPGVRRAAALAMIHLKLDTGLRRRLESEQDPPARGQLLEALGRLDAGSEPVLAAALAAPGEERNGALRGLEALVRLNPGLKPAESTLAALSRISLEDSEAWHRRLAATIVLRVADPRFIEARRWWSDADDQMRRLAARSRSEFREDRSYLVRYEGLRASGDCAVARGLTSDPSPHVRTLAVELLAGGCAPEHLLEVSDRQDDPLLAARAVLSLAKSDPAQARSRIGKLRSHSHWRVRALLAEAAVRLADSDLRRSFLGDAHPNVVSAALATPEEALAVLEGADYGLLVKALGLLEGWAAGSRAVPVLLQLWTRLTGERKETSRDPRRMILERLSEFAPEALRQLHPPPDRDFDSSIVLLGARLLGSGANVPVVGKALMQLSEAEAEEALSLRGARARIRFEDGTEFTLELLAGEAPVTVLRFVQRAREGYYDGLTFHRIEPNFVIQGGSPGANEYAGAAAFTRDELSSLSHLRGTVGISTRGRDTGDGQIFVNLVDNYRLDHAYTIFARVSAGMDRVDRVRETDVIASVEILLQ